MVIENIDGNEYYNYHIKEMKIIDHHSSEALHHEGNRKDYASDIRNRKTYGKCKRFRRFLYNKEEQTSCNRSGKHWGSMIFYYVFFLGLLLILFMSYFYGVNRAVVHRDRLSPPLDKFYTGLMPTFTYVPVRVNMLAYPIIWYKFDGTDSPHNRRSTPYVEAIRDYYKRQATVCTKRKSSICSVDPSNYGPCGEGTFGYDEQQPCIILKLNTISGWRPDAFHSKYKVPKTMPQELFEILDLTRETLCVHCSGSTLYDQEHVGKIAYHPEPCFNDSFFPYNVGPLNVNPTLAIQLKNTDPGYVLSVTCRLFGLDADGTGEYQQSLFVYIGQK